jgi:hypothetical protein
MNCNTTALYSETVFVKEGFWRATRETLRTHECRIKGVCLGGVLRPGNSPGGEVHLVHLRYGRLAKSRTYRPCCAVLCCAVWLCPQGQTTPRCASRSTAVPCVRCVSLCGCACIGIFSRVRLLGAHCAALLAYSPLSAPCRTYLSVRASQLCVDGYGLLGSRCKPCASSKYLELTTSGIILTVILCLFVTYVLPMPLSKHQKACVGVSQPVHCRCFRCVHPPGGPSSSLCARNSVRPCGPGTWTRPELGPT